MAAQLTRLVFCIAFVALWPALIFLLLLQIPNVVRMVGLPATPFLFAILFLTLWALVLVHELGHVAAGLAFGFPFLSLTIPFLTVTRVGDRLQFRLNAVFSRDGIGGKVSHAWRPGRPSRWALLVAGGPAASLLAGAGLLLLAFATSASQERRIARPATEFWQQAIWIFPDNLLAAWLNIAGIWSLAMGIGALLPRQVGKFRTDGAQIVDVLQGKHPALHFPNGLISPNGPSLSAPAVTADAPDVEWDDDARAVLAGLDGEAEALGDDYLGTRHLFLAAVAVRPDKVAVGILDHAHLREAVATILQPREKSEPTGTARWPTPRLRQAVALAAMRAIANNRPANPRDFWHAILTESEGECRSVLDHFGLNQNDLLKTLA